MNKSIKIAAAFAATSVAAIAGVVAIPKLVNAWGDNSEGGQGRPSYTLDQINQGALGDKIVFNTISDGVIGNEKNFVGARENTNDNETLHTWNGNHINVEEGKEYVVRLYVHNNNPNGTAATAEDVKVLFSMPMESAADLELNGFIFSSNATPTTYWDYVRFHSTDGRPFYLDYVEGSALLENNGVGKGGVALSDSIITKDGVNIGYDALDGKVPGCFKYANYITIRVKPVFTDHNFTVIKQVRKVGSEDWHEAVDAKVGDQVEYEIFYQNTTENDVENVMVKDVLPTNLKIVSDVVLYNTTNPDGLVLNGDIVKNGINIGGYAVNAGARVYFTAEVVDNSLICGINTLRNWGQIGIAGYTLQDNADVVITKTCDEPKPEPEKEKTTNVSIDKKVRLAGSKDWVETVNATIGQTVEYQLTAKNTGETTLENVMVSDTLPAGLELTGDIYVNGKKVSGDLAKGINVGTLEAGKTAVVTFSAKVVDNNLICGKNTLTNTGKAAASNKSNQDTAVVITNKTCSEEKKDEPTSPKEETKKSTTTTTVKNVESLPSTGPAEIVGGVLGAGSVVTAAGYYISSRKKLQ